MDYLDEMKDGGEKITPKAWRAETERLVAHEKALYQQMKAMRTDVQAVDKIHKTPTSLPGRRKAERAGRSRNVSV